MIRNKKDLKNYISADFKAQGMEHPFLARLTYGENWQMFSYMRTLRYLEYYKNTRRSLYGKLLFAYYLLRHRRNCLKYGITIAPNVVGPGYTELSTACVLRIKLRIASILRNQLSLTGTYSLSSRSNGTVP